MAGARALRPVLPAGEAASDAAPLVIGLLGAASAQDAAARDWRGCREVLTQAQRQAARQAPLFARGVWRVEGDLLQLGHRPDRGASFTISISTNGRPESSVLPST